MRAAMIPLTALILTVAGAPAATGTGLKVTGPFGDHMVIQRGAKVPIVGTANPGSKIAVTIGTERSTARADDTGRWKVTLGPFGPGAPRTLTVESDGESLVFSDVVVGDVWVCGGQSNMEWQVADSLDGAKEVAAADDPSIRHFKVPRSWAAGPEDSLAGGSWEAADPSRAGRFTAVGYFFARELRPHVRVPIGLVNSSWGGSRLEPWMSAAALGLGEDGTRRILADERAYEKDVLEKVRARLGTLPDRDAGLADGRAVWADPGLDDARWRTIRVPARWEEAGFDGMDGVAWYRTAFDLTAEEARGSIKLGLGPIDDSDITWVNGHEVGRTTLAWNVPRVYGAPPAFLKAGRNVVAVRVEDTGGGGGIWGQPDSLFVEIAGKRRVLAGEWRFRPAVVNVNMDFHKNQVPTVLFNKMVHPLVSFPIKGVIWYQGESNAAPADAVAYRKLFPAMIEDWRAAWGLGKLPFLFVQLANFRPPVGDGARDGWPLLRESQTAALALPMTGQAVTIDIGDANDIHPRNKQGVGRRLALAARKVAYGENVVASGPVYAAREVRDGRLVIAFREIGGGLVAKGGMLSGFEIAGADRRFVPARAAIEGDRVVVRAEAVPNPVAVRYAWADDPTGANLYNVEGLPASPFRTDDW